MKHVRIGGQIRNLDKTWSHLKMNQKDWIFQKFREEYINFLNENYRHPNKVECAKIVNTVYNLIEEKGIWIPYNEVRKAFSGKLNRYKKIVIPAKDGMSYE